MSSSQGTKLRNGKVFESTSKNETPVISTMSDPNSADSDSNEISDVVSQLTEIKESYEKRISELQTEFSELKGLMMSVLKKIDVNSPSTSSQGLSKQPQSGLDT